MFNSMIIRLENFTNNQNSINEMGESEYLYHLESVENHIDVMIMEGRKWEEINEDFSDILSQLGGGFKQKMYQYAAQWVLEKMGLPTSGWYMELATQIITKIDFTNITSYFGKGSCKPWATAIQEGIIYFLTNKLGDVVLGEISPNAGSASTRSGIANTLIGTIGNAAAEGIKNTEFVAKIENAIQGKICGEGTVGFGDIFGGKNIPDTQKNQIKSELHQASKDNPEIMGQAKSLGMFSWLFGGK